MLSIRVILTLLSASLLHGMFIPEAGLARPIFPFIDKKEPLLAHILTDKQVYRSLDHIFIEVFFSNPITKVPVMDASSFEHIQINLKVR
jgi:hypothetical protein